MRLGRPQPRGDAGGARLGRGRAVEGERTQTLLHVDIGGGTTKLGLLHDGEILSTAAMHVGGRLVALDDSGRVTRIEPSAKLVAEQLGIRLELGRAAVARRTTAPG